MVEYIEAREPRDILFFGVRHSKEYSFELVRDLRNALIKLRQKGLESVRIGAELTGLRVREFEKIYPKYRSDLKAFEEFMRPKIKESLRRPPFTERFDSLPPNIQKKIIDSNVSAYTFFFNVYRAYKAIENIGDSERFPKVSFVELEDAKLNAEFYDSLLDQWHEFLKEREAKREGRLKDAAKHRARVKEIERKLNEINCRRNIAMAKNIHWRYVNIPILGVMHSPVKRYLKQLGHRVQTFHAPFRDLLTRIKAYWYQVMYDKKTGFTFVEPKRKKIGPRHHPHLK